MYFSSQFTNLERLMVILMVMLHADTEAVYFTAHLGLNLGTLKVAEPIFSSVKNRLPFTSLPTLTVPS